MHAPALALGWELWAGNRRPLSVIVVGGVLAVVLVRVLPDESARTVAEVALLLMFAVYVYLLSVFIYSEGSLGGRSAGFPSRLFTLPVRTAVLVGLPMLYGVAAAVLLWVGMLQLILLPVRLAGTMEWWPGLLLAACLAWFQAVCWTLVRSPLMRLVVAILGIPSAILAGVLVLAQYDIRVTRPQVTGGLGVAIGLAYLVAVAGVSRDRRGDALGWAWVWRLVRAAVPRLPGGDRPFRSAASAQRWLEARRHAWPLPAAVGLFLAMLFWGMALPLEPGDVAKIVLAVVGVPAALAFFVGFGMGKTSFWARDLRLSAFTATRPMSPAELARAKLWAAWLAALTTWGLILAAFPLWAVASENVETVRRLGEATFRGQPGWKLGLLAPVALAGLVGLTGLQLVAGMCLSLTGRTWVVNGVAALYVAVAGTLLGLGLWTAEHPDFLDTLRVVLWCLGGGLGLLKLGVAGWVLTRNDLPVAGVVRAAVVWLAVAAGLLVPFYALCPEIPVSRHLIALFVTLALPFTRLAALPAAVAWNRHR